MNVDLIKQRLAGILMPISSLPSPHGIGTLGGGAYEFVEFLCGCGMKIWQMLPIVPTGYGDSPYQALSAKALNFYFIDLELLSEDGLLDKSEYESVNFGDNPERVDYEKLFLNRIPILKIAYGRFDKKNPEFMEFINSGQYRDFSLFMALKEKHGFKSFDLWDEKFRKYRNDVIDEYIKESLDDINFWEWTSFIFLKQWKSLKEYANKRGILIMGDIPIYVASDSLEMWKYGKELFLLDKDGSPSSVAGVPPDDFCEDGQLWGNPLFNWDNKESLSWWEERIELAKEMFDIVRIDHFRAFSAFYAIDNGEKNARQGRWIKGPGAELFLKIGKANIVAEDLGVIDDDVRDLLIKTGYPGMRVLEFAFDGNPKNEHKPSNYNENCFAYTGTHDNPPLISYIESLDENKLNLFDVDLMRECKIFGIEFENETNQKRAECAIKLLLTSRAGAVILPMQDMLFMSEKARINTPSTVTANNWSYRFLPSHFSKAVSSRIKEFLNVRNL